MPHEPKKRHSKQAKRTRRAALAMTALKLVTCTNCNFKTISHMACRNCGYFGGKKVGEEAIKVTRA